MKQHPAWKKLASNPPQNLAQPIPQMTGLMPEDDRSLRIFFEKAMDNAGGNPPFTRTKPLGATRKADGCLMVTARNAEDAGTVAKFLKGQYGIKDTKADPSIHAVTLGKDESRKVINDLRLLHEVERLNDLQKNTSPTLRFSKEREGIVVCVSGDKEKAEALKFLKAEGYPENQLEIKDTEMGRPVRTGQTTRWEIFRRIIIPTAVLESRYPNAFAQNLSDAERKALKNKVRAILDGEGVELEHGVKIRCSNGKVTVSVTQPEQEELLAALEKEIGVVDRAAITTEQKEDHRISHIPLSAGQVDILLDKQQAASALPSVQRQATGEAIAKDLTDRLNDMGRYLQHPLTVKIKESNEVLIFAKDTDANAISDYIKSNGITLGKHGSTVKRIESDGILVRFCLTSAQMDQLLGRVVVENTGRPLAAPTPETVLKGLFDAAGVTLKTFINIREDEGRMVITIDNYDRAVVEEFLKKSGFEPKDWNLEQLRVNTKFSHITLPEALQKQIEDAVNAPVAAATPVQRSSWISCVPQKKHELLLKQDSDSHPYLYKNGGEETPLEPAAAKVIAEKILHTYKKRCFGTVSGSTSFICMGLPSDPHQRHSLHSLLELCGVKEFKSDGNRGILSVSSANEKSFGALEKALGKTFDQLPCERDFQQHQIG